MGKGKFRAFAGAQDAGFNESDHPRDQGGKFSSGGGGGGGSSGGGEQRKQRQDKPPGRGYKPVSGVPGAWEKHYGRGIIVGVREDGSAYASRNGSEIEAGSQAACENAAEWALNDADE